MLSSPLSTADFLRGWPPSPARHLRSRWHDEAFAFDLWASPRSHPRVLVLNAQSQRKRPPIWVALTDGGEIRKPDQLPKGAFFAMRAAANTTDAVGMVWDDQ